jgi:stage II sporulation protein D
MSIRGKLTALVTVFACAISLTVPLVSEVNAKKDALPLTTTEPLLPSSSACETLQTEPPPQSTEPNVSLPNIEEKEITVGVYITDEDRVTQMTLEEYITCVVAAEMPYTFYTEALKAQAVAARTYCIYKLYNGSTHEGGAQVCSDYSHCAAFVTRDELLSRYGEQVTNSIVTKISNAVKATEGQILTYDDKPILAAFHSRSYKYTESSLNVWGGYRPYLISVSSPESDSISSVTLTDKQISELFSSSSAIECATSSKNTLTSEKNDSGRQSYLMFDGKMIKAKLLRSLFGFRSTAFEYEKTEDGYVFTVHGYGHGVGMSQYGANEMAKCGAMYDEILTHYYTGVSFDNASRFFM